MNILKSFFRFLSSLFSKKRSSEKGTIRFQRINNRSNREIDDLSDEPYEEGPKLLVDKESYESVRLVNTFQPFKPNLGDLDPSVSLISKLDRKNASAYLNRGNLKLELHDFLNAITDYTLAIEINPQYSKAYYNRARAKKQIQELDGADEDERMYIKLTEEY